MKKGQTAFQDLPKVATFINGLDDIMLGGIAKGRSTLLQGGPGTGKSLLGLEILYRNALEGVPGIFVAFEESAESVRRNALTMGWDLTALEDAGHFYLLDAKLDPANVMSGEFNLNGLMKIIEAKANAMPAQIIVLDALDTVLQLMDDPKRERTELNAVHCWLMQREMTSLFTAKKRDSGQQGSDFYEFLDYMVDCVIQISQPSVARIATRSLRVVKYRGSNFGKNVYPFCITDSGVEIISTSLDEFSYPGPGKRLSTGIPELDNLLGGGIRSGSSLLINGPSGIGKTSMSSHIMYAAHIRGERVLSINFEESQDSVVSSMQSIGISLETAVNAGSLEFLTSYPESQGSEEHLILAMRRIKRLKPAHVVVDAISACERMGSEQAAFNYLTRLISFLKPAGITCTLINQATQDSDIMEISGIGISSLMDCLIHMRYVNQGGELNRALVVLKSRGSRISNQWREFVITSQGLKIKDIFVGLGGALTGAARLEQEQKQAALERTIELNIRSLEEDIKAQKIAIQVESARAKAKVVASEAQLEDLLTDQHKLREDMEKRTRLRTFGDKAGEEND